MGGVSVSTREPRWRRQVLPRVYPQTVFFCRMPGQPLDRIESNPDVLSGQPVVRGTRLPVYVLVDAIAEGDSVEDLLEAYPFLERADVQQALHFAARMSRVEEAVA